MNTLFTAKCAYSTGSGTIKGCFYFSVVAEYVDSSTKKHSYRKFYVAFHPSRSDLRAKNLGINFTELMKNRTDSFVFSNCPYSANQLLFIYPNIKTIAATFDTLKQSISRSTGQPKDSRSHYDKESGLYFVTERPNAEEIDFINFHEAYKDKAILLIDKGVSKY